MGQVCRVVARQVTLDFVYETSLGILIDDGFGNCVGHCGIALSAHRRESNSIALQTTGKSNGSLCVSC